MIKRRDLPLYALRGFEATARLHSLTDAAEELGVTYSAISHQIRKLEEILGTTLFDRRHKPLSLTAKGHALLSGVTDSFDRLSRAAEEAGNTGLEGELVVSCIPGLGTNWLIPALEQFLKSYTKLNLHIITEFWHHPTPHEEIDLAITYGSAERTGRRVIRLGQSEFFPVCSPRIMDGLLKPQDLAGITLLHDHSEETWSRWLLEAGHQNLEDRRNIYFDSAHMALEAARAGYGVAMGDRPTVQHDLREGRLIRLFDHSVPAIHPYYIDTPPLEHMKPATKALEAWLVDQF
ncbi:MAG: LysR family transcriptional regulator [Rhodospirillales bacterium]|nr:LysR family transcriptional regulator [Rhodospirillales bacterium]